MELTRLISILYYVTHIVKLEKWRETMKRVRDSQRKKVYDWEIEVMRIRDSKHVRLSLNKCRTLVNNAITWYLRLEKHKVAVFPKQPASSRSYSVDEDLYLLFGYKTIRMPSIRISKSKGGADANASILTFGKNATTKPVVLHETAHAIVDILGIEPIDGGHGKYFARVYIELLNQFTRVKYPKLTRTAKGKGVTVSSESVFDLADQFDQMCQYPTLDLYWAGTKVTANWFNERKLKSMIDEDGMQRARKALILAQANNDLAV